MDELIQQVSQRTGLSEDQARQAVQATLDYLKPRLPGPAQGILDQALGSGQASGVTGNPFGRDS